MSGTWTEQDGALVRVFEKGDFDGALAFVNAVAEVANRLDHHPDVDIRWGTVTLRLRSHDKGEITARDHRLAQEIDELDR